MASSENILAIASHLQNLESAFSGIIIEAFLKMATLTESKLFVLMETPEGRKFAGHSKLTHLFKTFQLFPQKEDQELEAKSEFQNNPQMFGGHPHEFASPLSQSCNVSQGQSGDFSMMNTTPSFYPSIIPQSAHSLLGDSNPSSPHSNRSSPKKPAKRFAATPHSSTQAKNRKVQSPRPTEHLEDRPTGHLEDLAVCEIKSEDVEEVFIEEHVNEGLSNQDIPSQDFPNGDAAVKPPGLHAVPMEDWQLTPLQEHSGHGADDLQLTPEVDFLRDFHQFTKRWSLSSYLLENPKAVAVKQETFNYDALTEKGSVEYKLLTSLIWDISKQVAEFVPDEREAKSAIVNVLFEEFWSCYPRLQYFNERGITIKNASGKEDGFRSHWRGTMYIHIRNIRKRLNARFKASLEK